MALSLYFCFIVCNFLVSCYKVKIKTIRAGSISCSDIMSKRLVLVPLVRVKVFLI